MKNFIYITLFAITSCFFTSCNDYDDPNLNPNEFLGNPVFDITAVTSNIDSLGGDRTISIKTNTKWWTVKSNQSWATVTSDTLYGDSDVMLKVGKNTLAESREVTLTFQSGTIGPKQTLKFVQDGLPATINVNPTKIETDAFGGSYEINVESNSSWKVEIVMDQDADLKWCSVDSETGTKDGKVTIKIEKNANVKLDERTASIRFIADKAIQTVSLQQIGNASCDDANNTEVLYFDSFIPCENSNIGDTWTLTDRRDGNTYTVRKMEDGQIWMVQDLRFAGDTGKEKPAADLKFFNGDGIAELEIIPGYLGDVCYPTVKAFDAKVGYFYNWMAVMQDARAVDAGKSQSFVVTEPYQGIAPFGWHIPSSNEFKALDKAFGSDPAKWGENGPWQGAFGGNLNETGTSHWGVGANSCYWTSTQTGATEVSASAQQKAHIWKFYKATSTASEVVVSQPKKYGFTVRLVKNK